MNTSIRNRRIIQLSGCLFVALSAALAVIPASFAATGDGRDTSPQCDSSSVLPEFGPPGTRTHRRAQSANCHPLTARSSSTRGAHPSPCRTMPRLLDYGQPGLRTHRMVTAPGCVSP